MNKINIAIIGASGYTGIELIGLLATHSRVNIKYLVANSSAGKNLNMLYPHFDSFLLPDLVRINDVNFDNLDLVFFCLPHTYSQDIISNIISINPDIKIIDLSADFRLEDIKNYKKFYKKDHKAPDLQQDAVYGLSEIYESEIKKFSIVACPGCYPTSILLPIIPLLKNDLICMNNIIADSKSGISGAGRKLMNGNLYCEVNDSVKIYSVGIHRHLGEINQEVSKFAKEDINVTFTPHIVPMSRGIISTIYLEGKESKKNNALEIIDCLLEQYKTSPFVKIFDSRNLTTREVIGTNMCKISVFKLDINNRIVISSVIDNLVKGSSGQAVQNMNIMFNFPQDEGLNKLPKFP